MKTARKPTPVVQAAEGQLIESLFTAPVKHGRTFRAKLDTHSGKNRGKGIQRYWIFGAVDDSNTCRYITARVDANLDQTVAEEIAKDLASMLNPWPGGLDNVSSPDVRKDLQCKTLAVIALRAAMRKHNSNTTMVLRNPFYSGTGYPNITVKMSCIDPVSGQEYELAEKINPSSVGNTDAPIFPGVRFAKPNYGGALMRGSKVSDEGLFALTRDEEGNDVHASCLPDDLGTNERLRDGLVKAENVGRALIAKLEGSIINNEAAKKLVKFYTTQWGRATLRQSPSGPYGGHQLIRTTFSFPERRIETIPTDQVKADVSGKIPRITIRSLDRTRVIPVLDTITQTWLEAGDLKKTFLAGHEAGRRANDEISSGIPSLNAHQCSDTNMCRSATRHCGRCGDAVQCSTLTKGIFNHDICRPCKDLERTHTESLPELVGMRSLAGSFRLECEKLGLNQADVKVQKVYSEAQTSLKQCFPDIKPTWHDGYRSKEVGITHEVAGARDPCAPSVEAVFPYYPALPTQDLKHCAGNIDVVSVAENLGLNAQLPALLHVLKYNLSVAEAKPAASADELHKAQKAVVDACTRLKKIRVKANFQAIVRAKMLQRKKKISKRRFELDMEEWRYGKLRATPGPWNEQRYLCGTRTKKITWRGDTLDRIKALIAMLEEEFRTTLVRSADGCPWIGSLETMPHGWSWELCASIMAERLDRMEKVCNVYDVTVETPDTIFIEIIFVACVIACEEISDGKYYTADQKKSFKEVYAEFLDLPMTADLFNALCFAMAHKYHGMMMATGWIREPKTPADRSDEHNNLLIESRVKLLEMGLSTRLIRNH